MRQFALIAVLAISTLSGISAPAMAGSSHLTPSLRPVPGRFLCVPPQVLTKECVSYGQAAAGQLFGPCLKYAYQCETQSRIQ